MTLHFSILLDQCGFSFESAALPWAEMGYPIIPIVEKRRARKGLLPSRFPEQIRAWARAFPKANPGVVLNEIPVVVLDVDGEQGERALTALLASAGCSLPPTYEETTGRVGGRHIFLRLPSGSGLDKNQYGGTRGRPAGLDILVNGHVVVAGARHKSGRFYTSLYPMRQPGQLAEMPLALHRLLTARAGRALGAVEVHASPAMHVHMTATPPANVTALLEDTSDGRDLRAFVAVSRLSELGWAEDDVVRLVLGSPLGAKAREQSPWDPRAWVLHKLNSVREQTHFNRDSYWVAVHTSGLGSAPLRILDFLLGAAGRRSGIVGIGYSKIGIGSAMDQPRSIMQALIASGWLVVLREADIPAGRPTLYGLTVPSSSELASKQGTSSAETQEPHRPSPTPPSPPDEWSSGWFMTATSGHDAFRRARGSLNACYPLFTLLGPEPSNLDDLARWLRKPRTTVIEHAGALARSGVAVWAGNGVALAPEGLDSALTAVAQGAGTDGARIRSYRRYLEACGKWSGARADWLAAYDVVGSDTWVAHTYKQILGVFSTPTCASFREELCERGGWQLEDLSMAVVMAHLERLRRRGPLRRGNRPSLAPPTHEIENECSPLDQPVPPRARNGD